MANNNPSSRAGPSRRAVLTYGTIATTGGIIGRSRTATASSEPAETDSSRAMTVLGAMFPYQYAPGRWTVSEANIDWRPNQLGPSYRTHVISYDRSRSFRAFAFTEADLPRRSGSLVLTSRTQSSRTPTLADVTAVELSFEE